MTGRIEYNIITDKQLPPGRYIATLESVGVKTSREPTITVTARVVGPDTKPAVKRRPRNSDLPLQR
jgi:hypothetical protein